MDGYLIIIMRDDNLKMELCRANLSRFAMVAWGFRVPQLATKGFQGLMGLTWGVEIISCSGWSFKPSNAG